MFESGAAGLTRLRHPRQSRCQHTYDVAGIRDSKTVTTSSGTITYNYLTQNGQVVRQTWTDLGNVSHVMDFIYDNNGKPYAFYYDGTLYYYITNLQGDVIRIIDTAGATICTYTYDAWGRLLNSSTNQIFKANPIRYRGYYYDTESGLYYLGSRYYDPQVKRFINADGYASTGQGFVGCNMFAYCGNNPIRFVDLNGCFWEEARDFFKNIYDNIGRIIGPDITVVYQSRTDDPDPTPECPLIIVSGEYATETLFEAGSSERIVTVQEQFRTDNIFE